MRALVLHEVSGKPVVEDFNGPTAAEKCCVVDVMAAGLNPVDRVFASMQNLPFPRAVGTEGVGTLPDGRRVYFNRTKAPFGSVAEQALAPDGPLIELPAALSAEQAIIIGISGLAGWMPLAEAAKLRAGETVLVLGATGAQGQIAVQAAKLLGAGWVVAAGRNRDALESLRGRGVDDIVVLEGDMTAAFRRVAGDSKVDVVIDSLYGQPHEALLNSGILSGSSRLIVVGASAGQVCSVSFSQLQSMHGATITGYSNNDMSTETVRKHYLQMADHIMNGKLALEVESFPLERAAEAWAKQAGGPHHKIIVTVAP